MTNKESSATSDFYCLQISNASSISYDSEISSFSSDREVESYDNLLHSDELPAFEIRLISPLGRTPSPIDSDFDFLTSPSPHSCITPTRTSSKRAQASYKDNDDYVTLHDINAQISPPSDTDSTPLNDSNRANNLETIFEGVFLNTPPRPKIQRHSSSMSRSNLLEKIAINRLSSADKENTGDKTPRRRSHEKLTET